MYGDCICPEEDQYHRPDCPEYEDPYEEEFDDYEATESGED